jgi:hypothetical protein
LRKVNCWNLQPHKTRNVLTGTPFLTEGIVLARLVPSAFSVTISITPPSIAARLLLLLLLLVIEELSFTYNSCLKWGW